MSTGSKASRSRAASATTSEADKVAIELERLQELRAHELSMREMNSPSPWRSPLVIAVAAAAVAGVGNAVVSHMNATSQARLEQVRAEQNLIIEAIKTGGEVRNAAANLSFLVSTGLVTDRGRSNLIKAYIRDNRDRPERLPALPATGQTSTGQTSTGQASRREQRMAVLQLTATPSDGLQRYRLLVDGRNVRMGANHRAQIEIAGDCGDRSIHRLSYSLIGPTRSKLNVALACEGRPIRGTGEAEVSEIDQPFAAGSQDFRL